MALYSSNYSFLSHYSTPEYLLSRHCSSSQSMHPHFHSQQLSFLELVTLPRIQPCSFTVAQLAAASSSESSRLVAVQTFSENPKEVKASVASETRYQNVEETEMASSPDERGSNPGSSRMPMAESRRTRRGPATKSTSSTFLKPKIQTIADEEVIEMRNIKASVLQDDASSERLRINLDLDLYHAKCLFRKRENKKAEAILRQCIKDWPTDGRAYVLLGTRLMKQGRYVDARTVFEDGCQAARGENPYIWQAWAMLEQTLGHLSEARKLFDAATAANIRHAAAWHGWAVLELRQGNTRKARELLSKGLKYCGGNEYLYQTSALIEYRSGKVEEARALFSQAIYYNSKSCASWLAWALMESEEGNNSTARYLFQRAIRASPKNRYAWQAWALFESSQGNKDWARRLFQEGVELNPYDAVLLQAFALFEYGSSDLDSARELFEKAASVDPKHQPIWNGWGWMEWKEGNLDLARQYYKKSLSVNSRNVEAARTFYAWAILEEGAGNYAAARELFKCTLRVDSQNSPAWRAWARLEENVGNPARAEEIRMQYLQERTEVVEDVPWDVSFSGMFAPAVNRIKEFLGIDVKPITDEDKSTVLPPEIVDILNKRRLDMNKLESDEDFDIDAFIEEVLPWKYKPKPMYSRQVSRALIVTNVSD